MKRFKGVTGFPLAIIIFLSFKAGYSKGKLQGYKDRLYEEMRQWYDGNYSDKENK